VAIRAAVVPFLLVLDVCVCAAKFETADQTMIVTGHVLCSLIDAVDYLPERSTVTNLGNREEN
jgi:hypothetical protein